jgi:hypothetical protein
LATRYERGGVRAGRYEPTRKSRRGETGLPASSRDPRRGPRTVAGYPARGDRGDRRGDHPYPSRRPVPSCFAPPVGGFVPPVPPVPLLPKPFWRKRGGILLFPFPYPEERGDKGEQIARRPVQTASVTSPLLGGTRGGRGGTPSAALVPVRDGRKGVGIARDRLQRRVDFLEHVHLDQAIWLFTFDVAVLMFPAAGALAVIRSGPA